MFILNVLIVNLHRCVFPLEYVELASDGVQLSPEFVNTVIPVFLYFLNPYQLHLIVLHLIEHILIQFLHPLTLIAVLDPLIIRLVQGKLQVVLLRGQPVNERLVRF